MLEHKVPSLAQTPPDPVQDEPPRIDPPPDERPTPSIEPEPEDPQRIDDPPRDPHDPPRERPAPSGIDRRAARSERAHDPWHVLHYRALERRQTRPPHLLRVGTWEPLEFRIVAYRIDGHR